MDELIFFAALLVFLFGLVSAVASRSPVTAPMFFVAVGVLAGPLGFAWYEAETDSESVQVIAELTLMLILFTDASLIDLRALKREYKIPLRLLGIGLPLTMLAGFLIGQCLFPGMALPLIAVMAFMLSPTDAALGQAVVASEVVPASVRDSIGVESGLNDGIALPPILACMAAIGAGVDSTLDFGYWGGFALKQLFYGPLVGAAVGLIGGRLVDGAVKRGWMTSVFQRLTSISLALVSYALAEKVGGNGFIAAFFGGLMLGTSTRVVRERLQEFGEAEGQLLSLFVFLIFGAVLVPIAWEHWSWMSLLYAVLSLTVIRMVPVLVSLLGANLEPGRRIDWASIGFIAWFGPRGIASVLYMLMFVGVLGRDGYEPMLSVVILTVFLSVFAHGLSAVPLSSLYGRWMESRSERG
ncbi:sodium:proton antiporter [Verrucomicrobiaceae bacterium N1E253]|uniref:Sodium:proton antiporter n=1 Tax=Oceaniferula marina TaxID=2748318 RepID=A0A851GEA5_9BACT|nr:sodium:proton antiporter [Oceaniferula marina]NWK55499.1 sodium:proton antiporter [Oceaniferula marina]